MKKDIVTYAWLTRQTCMSKKDLASFRSLYGDRVQITLTNLLTWIYSGNNGVFLLLLSLRFLDHATRGEYLRELYKLSSKRIPQIERRRRRSFIERMEARVLLWWSYYPTARRRRGKGIRP